MSESSGKRNLSNSFSADRPSVKRNKEHEEDDDSLLDMGAGDLFDVPQDEAALLDQEDIGMNDNIVAHSSQEPDVGGDMGDQVTPAPASYADVLHGNVRNKGDDQSTPNRGDQEKSTQKRSNEGESDVTAKRPRKVDARKSEFLLTFLPANENEGCPPQTHEKLLSILNDNLFALALHPRDDNFMPRIDFAKFQESDGKTIVGCADEDSVKWVRSVAAPIRELEAWDRREMAVFHTHVPKPSSAKTNNDIIQFMRNSNKIPGRIIVLKTEMTKGGKILVLGLDQPATERVTTLKNELYCGLFRLTLQPVKPKAVESGI